MKPCYLICHKNCFKGIQDYCDTLIQRIHFAVNIYDDTDNFQLSVKKDSYYLFFQMIPPNVLQSLSDLKNIFVINTEQLTRVEWLKKIKNYLRLGITIIEYDQYQWANLGGQIHGKLPLAFGSFPPIAPLLGYYTHNSQ